MPRQKLSIASFVILFVSLGAAATSLGLIQDINSEVGPCWDYDGIYYYTCELSVASAIIATIFLALLTVLELISVLYQTNVKTLIVRILYSGFFAISILFLIITTATVSYNDKKVIEDGNSFNIPEVISAAVLAGFGTLLTIVAFCIFIVKQTRSNNEYETIIQ